MNRALFEHIESAPPSKKFLVTVSYLEVCGASAICVLYLCCTSVHSYSSVLHGTPGVDSLESHGQTPLYLYLEDFSAPRYVH